MSRELSFDEILEYLKTHAFDNETCREIISIMEENVLFISIKEERFEKRIKNLEELTAKMDKILESQYNNYKKVT